MVTSFSADDILRAARGERVPGVTHSQGDEIPLGPGPLTPAGWRAFAEAHRHGFLVTTDTDEYGAISHIWRRWCAVHDLPEVTVSTRQVGRRAQEGRNRPAPNRVADVDLTLDRARRVLAPIGLLAVAEALVWAEASGEHVGCRWLLSTDMARLTGVPVEAAQEVGAALLRIGQDVRLTCPGPSAEVDRDMLQTIAERRHYG